MQEKNILLAKKEILKNEIIEKLKNGNFLNGIASSYTIIKSFSEEEISSIIEFWKYNRKFDLLIYYTDALILKDLELIELSDKHYLENLKSKEKFAKLRNPDFSTASLINLSEKYRRR